MYRLTHHHNKSKLFYLLGGVLIGVVVLVVAIVAFVHAAMQTQTTISQSPPVTHVIGADTTPTQHITNSKFAIDLPKGWHAVTNTGLPDSPYRWQGADPSESIRWIDIYVDNIPLSMPANHLLPVQANGNMLHILGSVSDNCVNFTDASTEDHSTGVAPAVWSGINFKCDMGNYERDVVLTGSPEGVNITTLRSPSGASRRVLLVYTDNSINPNYSIFSDAVKSFQLL